MDAAEKEAESEKALSALRTNANAVRAVRSAIESTLGPKGLDTMLVDRAGNVVVTNDGVTILEQMEANHPAARMLIHTARAQQKEVGDGTTTATLIAASLVEEGMEQVMRGVPVTKVVEGIRFGIAQALRELQYCGHPITALDAPALLHIAMVAGREYSDIAELVIQAAMLIGRKKLAEPQFKLGDAISAEENAENEVFMGVLVHAEPMNKDMPKWLQNVKLLVVDDALEWEELGSEALGTESGFKRYVELQEAFKVNLRKIVDSGVQLVLADRGVSHVAEEMLSDAGVMVVRRVEHGQLLRAAEHTGARLVKRTGVKKTPQELEACVGYADTVYVDEKLRHIRILGGRGKPMATVLVGAATREIVGERQRIARDAASSVQAALSGGYVAGGGATEIALAREIEKKRDQLQGMAAYGLDCVVRALKAPMAHIVKNAGYNPLEKVEEVFHLQLEAKKNSLGIDCDTGKIVDMLEIGIADPALVKAHAIKAAGEAAVSILKIDRIIRKKAESEEKEMKDGY